MRRYLILLPLFLIGCGQSTVTTKPGSSSSKPKVAFVSNNPDPFWSIVEAGCNKGGNEFGVEVVFRKPPSGDPAAQQEILDSLVNRDIKAIAVSVSEPKNQTAPSGRTSD